jgi:hypothetical protein
MVALPLLVKAPAVIVKLTVLLPDAMVKVAGSVTTGLLLVRVTETPGPAAGSASVTVQVPEAFGARLELHTRAGVASPTSTADRAKVIFTEKLL